MRFMTLPNRIIKLRRNLSGKIDEEICERKNAPKIMANFWNTFERLRLKVAIDENANFKTHAVSIA